jgi:hypothetical protein
MDGDWTLEANVTLNSSVMEETLIEMFGCVSFEEKVIKVYVSSDRRQMRRDVCMGDKVVDSQITLLPGFFENPRVTRGQVAMETRLAAA